MDTPNNHREPSIPLWRTVTSQAAVVGLVLIAILWLLPLSIWQGTRSLHIAFEFIAALLALVVALGGIVRYIALRQRLVLLFGLSFLGAGIADLINAAVSLDVLTTGQGTDPATWTAGRLTHGILLLSSLIVGKRAPIARWVNTEFWLALTGTIAFTGLMAYGYSHYTAGLFVVSPLRTGAAWAMILLFLWSAWGYVQLAQERRSAFLDWAGGAAVMFGVAQMYAALFAGIQESSLFIPNTVKLLGYIIALSGLFMENLALFQETERQRDVLHAQNQDLERTNRQLAVLLDVSRLIAEMRDLDGLLRAILEKATAILTQAETGMILLFDTTHERLVPKAALGFPLDKVAGLRIRPDEAFFGRVYTSGEPYICHAPDELAREVDGMEEGNKRRLRQAFEGKQPIQAMLCAPLIEHGDPIGVILLSTHTPDRPFSDHHVSFFHTLCNHAATGIRNAQLYHEVQQYANQLAIKNRELESFVYTASHDLRSPLVSLHGLMSMFGKSIGPTLDERGKRYLSRLEANVSQMEELIDGLLELSRVGRVEAKIEEISVNHLVEQLGEQLRPQLEKASVKLIIQPDMPVIYAPPVLVRQVFSNLMSNGIKFMGDSELREVEVGGREESGIAHFFVRDTGIGIDPAYHDKIFVIFQRLEELQEVKGTGVGLAIVRKIIENLGGAISIESEKGKGATFKFSIPIIEPVATDEEEVAAASSS